MDMMGILFAQMGVNKEDIINMGKRAMRGIDHIERRLERLESAAGITDPLPPGEYDEAETTEGETDE